MDLNKLNEEELLELRICELPIAIKDTWLEVNINKFYGELNNKDIDFKPKCYLADEWLTPDKEPVIGIPFYLAHPALIRLEQKMMSEAEGSTSDWCMKLLRHEAGHAINYAYELYKQKEWQQVFGHFDKEYADTYKFRPYSKSFVRHLEDYYAQYHPDEDFAETFAVWLTPSSDWENQYKGWKALKKLKYVDSIMSVIKNQEPVVKNAKEYWRASSLRSRLKNYYKKRKSFQAEDFPDFHDLNLKEIFMQKAGEVSKQNAGSLLSAYRKHIIESVSLWTGEKKYVIDDLVKKLIKRSRHLGLKVFESNEKALLKVTAYIAALVMNYVYTGKLRGNK
ncbi:MAG: hypothetical protein ABIB11_05945 [Candidatus Omnitrophota bacterium]